MANKQPISKQPHFKDLTGRTFTRWRVVDYGGEQKWNCVCRCGTGRPIATTNLVSGHSKSCGCLRRDLRIANNKTHGLSKLPEYQVWKGMIARCYNKNHIGYADYGGRGILVCDRWRHSFEAFIEDLGRRPTKEHSLERLDNSKGYYPDNVVWGTRQEQNRNSRRNRRLTYNGRTMCLSAWAEETGIHQHTIGDRIDKMGWSVERALTVQPKKPNEKIFYNGEIRSVSEWARHLGMSYPVLYERLKLGWPVERAFTEKVRGRK